MKPVLTFLIPPTMLLAACQAQAPANDAAAPAAAAPAPAAATGETPMPAGLTAEERVIWNSLSAPAKAQAAAYIANGGTLKQFVAI